MRRDLLDNMARVEASHWWFVGRRRLVAQTIESLKLPFPAQILDAGCGTGGNLATWAKWGELSAFEIDDGARATANERGITTVQPGHLPGGIPFDDERFDLVLSTDVLEHVQDDDAALTSLYAATRPGGWLILTVPAMPKLWSSHDEAHGHHRRYRRAELQAKVRAAGFQLHRCTHWNGLLLGAAAGQRVLSRLVRREVGPLQTPRRPLNQGLAMTLAAERRWLATRDLPAGVSLLLVARRPESQS